MVTDEWLILIVYRTKCRSASCFYVAHVPVRIVNIAMSK